MIFRTPLPFSEALQSDAVRAALPTDFTTDLIRTIAPDLRRRAVFSATASNADYVGTLQDTISKILNGDLGRAEGKLHLQKAAQLATGKAIGDDSDLRDLTSERRINLQVDTQIDMMQGAGQRLQATRPEVLDQFPAWELIRTGSAKDPRDWASIWAELGGTFYGGRMIAAKDDPIWGQLGNSALFADGLDNDFPPYRFGSHMRRVQIRRGEAEALGVIQPGQTVSPKEIDFNATLTATPELSTRALQEAVIEDLAGKGVVARVVNGVLSYIGGATA